MDVNMLIVVLVFVVFAAMALAGCVDLDKLNAISQKED